MSLTIAPTRLILISHYQLLVILKPLQTAYHKANQVKVIYNILNLTELMRYLCYLI